MIFRIFPTKDTFITNFPSPATNVPMTASNFGASEIIEVFKTGPSGTVAPHLSSSFARALLQFDIGQFGSLTGSASASYKLVLFNAPHGDFLPYSYDLQAHMLSQSWDEGRGLDHEQLSDLGFANWDKRKQGSFWSAPGGDMLPQSVSFHLDDGHEDVRMDVSNFVSSWVAGTPNNGILVRVSSSLEADANDYFTKKFHGRATNLLDRRPCLELAFDDATFTGSASQAVSGTAQYVVNINNLKNSYELIESPQLRLFVRTVDYNPAVVLTGTLTMPNLVVVRAYYRIDNDRTKEQVIPFGTGSYQGGNDSTRLSYDGDGNFFNFPMSNLSPGNVYRVVFLFDISGQRQLVDGGFKFKVV